MTKRQRARDERRQRAKHKAQKQRHKDNIIKDAERRLLGSGPADPATVGAGAMFDFYKKTMQRVSRVRATVDLTAVPDGSYSRQYKRGQR